MKLGESLILVMNSVLLQAIFRPVLIPMSCSHISWFIASSISLAKKAMSSAKARQVRLKSSFLYPILAPLLLGRDFSYSLIIFSRIQLNKVGDIKSPCLTSVLMEKGSDSSPQILTLEDVLTRFALIKLQVFLSSPSSRRVLMSVSLSTQSYAFWKSLKGYYSGTWSDRIIGDEGFDIMNSFGTRSWFPESCLAIQ